MIGLLSFLSFGLSVIAAVLAIDMYTLLRTGEFGRTWRVLIIASVMVTLAQVMRMAEITDARIARYGLSQIVELMFVMALAFAFFLQRKAFTQAAALRRSDERRSLPRAERRRSGEAMDDESDEMEGSDESRDVDSALEEPKTQGYAPTPSDEDPDIEWSKKPKGKRLPSPTVPSR